MNFSDVKDTSFLLSNNIIQFIHSSSVLSLLLSLIKEQKVQKKKSLTHFNLTILQHLWEGCWNVLFKRSSQRRGHVCPCFYWFSEFTLLQSRLLQLKACTWYRFVLQRFHYRLDLMEVRERPHNFTLGLTSGHFTWGGEKKRKGERPWINAPWCQTNWTLHLSWKSLGSNNVYL